MKTLNYFALSGCCVIAAGCATTPIPKEFPAEALQIQAPALKSRLSGNAYTAKLTDGNAWDMKFGTDGRYNLSTKRHGADQGRWRAEDSRLCVEFEGKFKSGCSEVRASEKMLYLKRSSTGEVVTLVAKP